MTILYHITKREYLDSIKEHGLVPFYREGLTTTVSKAFRLKEEPRVWLADDIGVPIMQLDYLYNAQDVSHTKSKLPPQPVDYMNENKQCERCKGSGQVLTYCGID